ncbi:MAG: type III-B CRISPR module-associated protein Cmr5 [Thiohalomonadaceae bacterium]
MSTLSLNKPRQTLEQQRAQDAWQKAEAGIQKHGKDYVNDAKGLPALIMNSGLMQVMAFLHQKQGRHETLGRQLREWLSERFPKQLGDAEFASFMQGMMEVSPHDYQAINSEAFAWLKWLRHMAGARKGGE